MFAQTPEPPYVAVIFTSRLNAATLANPAAYNATATRMAELVALKPGYLGVESARGADGLGLTVSYWASEADALAWKRQPEHQVAQETGRSIWYEHYATRVAHVKRAYVKR